MKKGKSSRSNKKEKKKEKKRHENRSQELCCQQISAPKRSEAFFPAVKSVQFGFRFAHGDRIQEPLLRFPPTKLRMPLSLRGGHPSRSQFPAESNAPCIVAPALHRRCICQTTGQTSPSRGQQGRSLGKLINGSSP